MSIPDVAPLLEGEPPHDQVVFATRLQRYWADLLTGLTGAYPDHAPEMAYRLVEIAAQNFQQRPADRVLNGLGPERAESRVHK